MGSTFSLVGEYGGYFEYDIDISAVSRGINAGLSGVFPNVSGSHYNHSVDYCDATGNPNHPWCADLQFIESNGNCGGASSWHTVNSHGKILTDENACNYRPHGCKTEYHYKDIDAFHMRIDFGPS